MPIKPYFSFLIRLWIGLLYMSHRAKNTGKPSCMVLNSTMSVQAVLAAGDDANCHNLSREVSAEQ